MSKSDGIFKKWQRQQRRVGMGKMRSRERGIFGAQSKGRDEPASVDTHSFMTIRDPVWKERLDYFMKISRSAEKLLDIWYQAWRKPWYMKFFAGVSSMGVVLDYIDAETGFGVYLRERGYTSLTMYIFSYWLKEVCSRREKSGSFDYASDTRIDFYEVAEGKDFCLVVYKQGESVISGPWLGPDCSEEEFFSFLNGLFWEEMPTDMVLLDYVYNNHHEDEVATFLPIEGEVGEYVGKRNEGEIIRIWKKYQEAGLNRTLLLYGPSGTGKSTVAMRVAKELKGKVLKMDLRALENMGIQTARTAFRISSPEILLIDDMDRFEDEYLLLSFLEGLGYSRKKFLVILTANRVIDFGSAILRPGRVDNVIEYRLPDEEQREQIAKLYMEKWPVEDGIDVEEVVAMTDGLSSAHILELVRNASVMGSKLEEMRGDASRMLQLVEMFLNGGNGDDQGD